MVKVKEVKKKTTNRRAKITVKSLLEAVRKKVNKKQVEAVTRMLEEKYDTLTKAEKVVKKIKTQIKAFENKDIEEIDIDEYEYNEEDEEDD